MVPDEQNVISLYRYRGRSSCERYLEALSVVENPAPAYRHAEKVTEPVVKASRSYAGFNPASRSDVTLFAKAVPGATMWCVASKRAGHREALAQLEHPPIRGTSSSKRDGQPFVEAASCAARLIQKDTA